MRDATGGRLTPPPTALEVAGLARPLSASTPRLCAPPVMRPRWRPLAGAVTSRARVDPHAGSPTLATTTPPRRRVGSLRPRADARRGRPPHAPPGGAPRGRPLRACCRRLWCSRLARRRRSPSATMTEVPRSSSRRPQSQKMARRGGRNDSSKVGRRVPQSLL